MSQAQAAPLLLDPDELDVAVLLADEGFEEDVDDEADSVLADPEPEEEPAASPDPFEPAFALDRLSLR